MASTRPARLLIAAAVCLLTLALADTALAGCEKDTDCKGDRICEKGLCTDPNPGSGVGRDTRQPSIDPEVLRRAAALRRKATGLAVGGWVLFGVGTVTGIQAIGFGLSDDDDLEGASRGLGGVATLLFGIAGPFAGDAGGTARKGVRLLGAKPLSRAPRALGWSFYGVGIGLGVAAVGLGIAEVDWAGSAVGGVAMAFGISGVMILLGDAAVHLRGLRAGIETGEVLTRADTRSRLRLVSAAPWVQPATAADPASRAGLAAMFVW